MEKQKRFAKTWGNHLKLMQEFTTCASSSTKRQLKFNPNGECVAGEAHHCKEAAISGQGTEKK